MKKLLAMFLCGIITVSMLTGCGSKNDAADAAPAAAEEEDNEAAADGADSADSADSEGKTLEGVHLTVGLSPTYANFETVTVEADGSEGYEGIDIEILAALAEKCGFTYDISNMNFASLIAAIQANQVDFVISGMSATDERKESVDFSDGYYTEKLGILYRTEDGFASAADLNGKTVSCANGENYEMKIPMIEGASLTTFENSATAIQELIAGRTDAVMTDGASCQIRCDENPELSYFVIAPEEIGDVPSQYAIAFPKESEYYDTINAALNELKDEGVVHEIIAKWLGEENAD